MIKTERELLTWIILIAVAVTAVFGAVTLRDMFGGQPVAEMKPAPEPYVTEPVVTTLAGTLTSPGKLSGAIFTTNPDGSIVNENVWYNNKSEVYLDGGPPPNAPVTSAGLPAGLYVFQVTNPSGKVLLSEDPSKCRIINISEDGVIIGLVKPTDLDYLGFNLDNTYTKEPSCEQGAKGPKKNNDAVFECHIADEPTPPDEAGPNDAGASERHDTNTDVDHWHEEKAIVVQLMPFFDTPNPGGVYKAWVTPLFEYLNDHGGDLNQSPVQLCSSGKGPKKQIGYEPDPGFGPSRADVKTDNFKVKQKKVEEPPEILVQKFHDKNANGVWDGGELEIGVNECVNETTGEIITCPGGWPVYVYEPGWEVPTKTEYTKFTYVVGIPEGDPEDYIFEEWYLTGWEQSVAYRDGTNLGIVKNVTVTVSGAKETHTVIFGNYMPFNISGMKFIDMNGNGKYDSGIDKNCSELLPEDVNKGGCSGVTIHLDGIDGMGHDVENTTDTDENGYYEFTGVIPGDYRLYVGEDEEDPEFFCSYPEDCEYLLNNVLSGEHKTGMDFGDFSKAEIHALKCDDKNGNGKCDNGDLGVPGVNFTLRGADGMNRPVDLWNLTDEDGYVSFLDLWPGNYTLQEIVPEGLVSSNGISVFFELTSDLNVTDVNFTNFIPAEKHGMKFIDMDGDGQYNSEVDKNCSEIDPELDPANKQACAGVEVHLDGKNGKGDDVNKVTFTDENGMYHFTNLWPGHYNITIDEDGFVCSSPNEGDEPEARDCRWEIELTSGENDTENNFGDFVPVNISAYKFFDFNGDGYKDEHEEFMSDIWICINHTGDGYVTEDAYGGGVTSCLETVDGYVEWNSLKPGNYTIWLNESLPNFCKDMVKAIEVTVLSGEVNVSWFGNYAPCNGLTPGRWKNWNVGQGGEGEEPNHYTEQQFTDLLQGTIADGNITKAEIILAASCGDDKEEMLECLAKFVLAHELTLNLNLFDYWRGGGNLLEECLINGSEYLGTLGHNLNIAYDMLNHPEEYTIGQIEDTKDILDLFANQQNRPACPVPP